MRNLAIGLTLLICSTTAAAGSYYTCTNPETGKKSFSRTPCGQSAVRRKEVPANSADYSGNSRATGRIERQAEASEARRSDVVEQRRDEVIQRRRARALREEIRQEQQECIDKARRNVPSGHALSVKVIAACKGQLIPDAKPRPSPAPSIITNCDAGGCWDNHGKRYNSGGGPTMIRQDGRVCQNIGGMMRCN